MIIRLLIISWAVLACHRPSPCGLCPRETTCDLDGTCRALETPENLRFTQAMRVYPSNWTAFHRNTAYADLDEFLLGGRKDGYVVLAFSLPNREIVKGILTFSPAPRSYLEGERTLKRFFQPPYLRLGFRLGALDGGDLPEEFEVVYRVRCALISANSCIAEKAHKFRSVYMPHPELRWAGGSHHLQPKMVLFALISIFVYVKRDLNRMASL